MNCLITETLSGRENALTDLTQYRLESAKERIESSKLELDIGHFKISITHSYYAIFNSVRALLAKKEVDFKKHSAVISYFRREYIKSEIFDKKFSDYIGDAFRSRNNSDYADFFIASREEAETQYLHAVEFYEAIKNYLESAE